MWNLANWNVMNVDADGAFCTHSNKLLVDDYLKSKDDDIIKRRKKSIFYEKCYLPSSYSYWTVQLIIPSYSLLLYAKSTQK